LRHPNLRLLNQDELLIFNNVLAAEVPTIEQEKIMELTTSWKEEGLQQGLHEGLQQGLHEGEAIALKRLLTRRFKELPAEVLTRIEQAVPAQLEQWIENTLDAATLEDVFKRH